MKKLLPLILALALISEVFSQKHMDYDFFPYKTEVKTLQFKVLDINYEKKILIFKHVYELLPQLIIGEDDRAPVDCKYAGMEKYPYAGVVLGMYDLEEEQYLKTFTIYESCMNKEDCFEHGYSEAQLITAKEEFIENGFDIGKLPKSLVFKKKDDKSNYLVVDGIKFSSSYKNDYDNEKSISYLYADDKLLYTVTHDDNFAMASHAEILYKAAYKKGNKIIFLTKYYHTNNMEGPRSYEFHYFSPVFEINNGKVTIGE